MSIFHHTSATLPSCLLFVLPIERNNLDETVPIINVTDVRTHTRTMCESKSGSEALCGFQHRKHPGPSSSTFDGARSLEKLSLTT
jgi:hypothetical protein